MMELLSKTEAELRDLHNSQPFDVAKSENTKDVARRPSDKEIIMHKPSQWRSGAVLQDNGRGTLKEILRSSGWPHITARVHRVPGACLPTPVFQMTGLPEAAGL